MAERDDFLEEILSNGPSAGVLFVVLRKMKQEGRLREVIRTCVRFIEMYPDDIRLRTLLAESYVEAGFIGLAGTELEKVAAMVDSLAPAYRLLGEIYAKQHRDGEAADMLRRYLAHYPGQAEAMELLRQVESFPSPEVGAIETAPSKDEVAPSEDEPADALVDFATPTIAELYYSQGQIDAAIHTYEKVLGSNPDDRESLSRLNELKGMMTAEPPGAEERSAAGLRAQKERLILTLERWLPKIREMRHA